MIEIIPAIDIIDGRCVRLTKGDYQTKKEYGDPVELAVELASTGIRRLHIVDLDGAKAGRVVNIDVLRRITELTKLQVDFGGGLRSDADMEQVFAAGAAMVTVGSVAVTDMGRYLTWLRRYGAERLMLGADVRDGQVSINGWSRESSLSLKEFLRGHISTGTRNVLCTDISRDGTMQGPATELYREIVKSFPECRLVASGGVRNMADVDALEKAGVPAVVVGKALYEGRITKEELRERCLRKG